MGRVHGHGEADVAATLADIQRLGLPLGTGEALDFGCGVGRLTTALASTFKHVEGVDASSEFVRIAAERNRYPGRVNFQVAGPTLPFIDGQFDLVLSLLVLQHIPPRQQLQYLGEFARVVKPGGILAFQFFAFPTRFRSRVAASLPGLHSLYRTVRYGSRRMDVYSVSPERVRAQLEAHGVSTVEARPGHTHPGGFVGYHVIGRKLNSGS